MSTSGELREFMLERYFFRHDKPLSNGDFSDNKLDLEGLKYSSSYVVPEVIAGLSALVRPAQPELVVGIPEGANWLGAGVAQQLGAAVLKLQKHSDGTITYANDISEHTVKEARSVAIIDDVRRTDSNLRKVLALPNMARRAEISAVIWDRDPDYPGVEGVVQEALISEHIPTELREDHPLLSYRR